MPGMPANPPIPGMICGASGGIPPINGALNAADTGGAAKFDDDANVGAAFGRNLKKITKHIENIS